MKLCKACGNKFASSDKTETLCYLCQGAIKRLNGYAVPVRHGEWIDTGTFDSHYTPIYQCSGCWKEVADNFISCHKYCLHCGAKMDGKADG